jgi:hypothetical protein
MFTYGVDHVRIITEWHGTLRGSEIAILLLVNLKAAESDVGGRIPLYNGPPASSSTTCQLRV